MTHHGNGAGPWLFAAMGVLGAFGCVDGTPEPDTGGATFFQGAPLTPGAVNDYTQTAAQPIDTAPAPGATSTPVTPAATPVMPTTPSMAAGSGGVLPPIDTAGTGASVAGAGGAGGTTPAIGGSGGAGMAGSAAPPPVTSSGPGTLSVSVTSASVGGRYAPRNVGAIWIETGSGEFVKTIERWVAIRTSDLRAWNQRTGGWGFSFFGTSSSPDAVDCVTAATLTNHRAHSPTWAMKDVDGMVVPDGPYKVVLEVGDGSNAVTELMFTKGPMAQTVMAPAGGRGYSSFSVTYTP
jgi:hypothetical protein